MIKNIFYWKYARPFTQEEKEAKFKLIKKQMKNAKCFDDVPALQPCIMFWELYGHRFTVDVEGSIFALFHRESEWGKKDNFFKLWDCPELETNTLNFINERLK